MIKQIAILLTAALIFAGGWVTHRYVAGPDVIERTDTVYVAKQVSFDSPDEVSSSPAPPVFIPRDSVLPTEDSSVVSVTAETVVFRDTSDVATVEAVVSGVQPKLESVSVSYLIPRVTTTQTIVKSYQGWKISATSNNAIYTQALMSQNCLELSYCTGSFQFGLQAGVLVTKPFPGDMRLDPYLGGRISVDILKLR